MSVLCVFLELWQRFMAFRPFPWKRFSAANLMTWSRNSIIHRECILNLDLENWAETCGCGSSTSHPRCPTSPTFLSPFAVSTMIDWLIKRRGYVRSLEGKQSRSVASLWSKSGGFLVISRIVARSLVKCCLLVADASTINSLYVLEVV